MFNPFRKQQKVTPKQYEKNSSEISIAADGQFSATGTSTQVSDTELEAKIDRHLQKLQGFYDQQAAAPVAENAEKLERLKRSIEGAKDDKSRRSYERSFLNIAEAYEACATLGSAGGWDLAWNVLNMDGLEAVLGVSRGQKELLSNSYADLLFARGMHCLRQMIASPESEAQNGYAQAAARMFFTYLIVMKKLSLAHWQINDAYKNIHIATNYGVITPEQLASVQSKSIPVAEQQSASAILAQVVQEVQALGLTETDHEKLKQMIH